MKHSRHRFHTSCSLVLNYRPRRDEFAGQWPTFYPIPL